MRRTIDPGKIFVVFAALLLLQYSPQPALDDSSNKTVREIASLMADLPLSFEANCGQADGRAKFISRMSGCTVSLTAEGASIAMKGDRVKMKLIEPRTARIVGTDEMSARASYFLGNDRGKWRADIPLYSKVRYEQVYRGIDLVYYGRGRGDSHRRPGAEDRKQPRGSVRPARRQKSSKQNRAGADGSSSDSKLGRRVERSLPLHAPVMIRRVSISYVGELNRKGRAIITFFQANS